MVGFLRFLVATFSSMALIGFIVMFVLCALIESSFHEHSTEGVQLFAAMLCAIVYFAGALRTSFPRFPPSSLGRYGAVLHLLLMPAAVFFVWDHYHVAQSFQWLSAGILFALLWLCMARSITSAVS